MSHFCTAIDILLSLMVVLGSIIFCLSVLDLALHYALGKRDGIQEYGNVLTCFVSAAGAIAVVYSSVFTVVCLFRLQWIFMETADKAHREVRALIRLKLSATLIFTVGCLAALGSLSLSVLVKGWHRVTDNPTISSGHLATGSLVLNLVSTCLFLVAHFHTAYLMSPCMPKR